MSNESSRKEPGPGIVSVNEIRDYRRINAELERLLNSGCSRIILKGLQGERLLVSSLRGPWNAVIELEGRAGPELAANLEAPNLMVIAQEAADGAACGLRAGHLLVRGQAGDAMGFEQSGGVVLLLGPTGHRAGLRMKGGTLIVIRSTGRLLGERQCGGDIFASTDRVGPFPGHGRLGGSLHRFIAPSELDARAKMILRTALRAFLPHLESTPVPSLEETCAP